LFVALVLPSLFALTFLAEGVHKIMQNEKPWVPFIVGLLFLGIILGAYFFLMK
jgi:hypothetical protein